ncbi:hypothetical protein PUN28_014925 [Cardiocondyla obscurior]|uniref:Uncharacterized protein n=1 Tax=Cardiocondyla obscurior TaxID=286306 RepID=A0AAW2EZK3_9HYME
MAAKWRDSIKTRNYTVKYVDASFLRIIYFFPFSELSRLTREVNKQAASFSYASVVKTSGIPEFHTPAGARLRRFVWSILHTSPVFASVWALKLFRGLSQRREERDERNENVCSRNDENATSTDLDIKMRRNDYLDIFKAIKRTHRYDRFSIDVHKVLDTTYILIYVLYSYRKECSYSRSRLPFGDPPVHRAGIPGSVLVHRIAYSRGCVRSAGFEK